MPARLYADRRRPWSDAELAQKVREQQDRWRGPTGRELLVALGEAATTDEQASP